MTTGIRGRHVAVPARSASPVERWPWRRSVIAERIVSVAAQDGPASSATSRVQPSKRAPLEITRELTVSLRAATRLGGCAEPDVDV